MHTAFFVTEWKGVLERDLNTGKELPLSTANRNALHRSNDAEKKKKKKKQPNKLPSSTKALD